MRDEGLWGRCQRLPKLEISESPWGRLGVCSLFTTLAGLAARPHTAAAWIHRAAAWVTYGCSDEAGIHGAAAWDTEGCTVLGLRARWR